VKKTVWAAWALAAALAATAALPGPAALAATSAAEAARPPQHDFLTQTEADKIRDAESANERVTLFLDFAADRLRRFHHELEITGAGPRQADFLNDLLNAFTACIDEASGRIDDAIHHGEDVRKGIKDMRKRAPEFAADLKKLKAGGKNRKLYQDALDDALDDLQYAIKDAEKAQKRLELNPPQRKPGGGERR
jgi:hypothetical protein